MELHDGIANDLLGMSMKIANASTPESIKAIQMDIDRLRGEVCNISHGMMPPDFSRLNLNEILNAYVNRLETIGERAQSMDGSISYAQKSQGTSIKLIFPLNT